MHHRLKAAGIHLLVSVAVAGLAAVLIFFAWYPPPFDAVSGGTSLFLLVMSVDVVAGPALTLVVASAGKPVGELRRDLAVIGLVQLFALGYGIYTVSLARPVVIAFEVDRFRVVSAADVDPAALASAPAGMDTLSWSGPRLIAAVKPTDPDELLRSFQLGLAGADLSTWPRNWRPYVSESAAAWRRAQPLPKLLAHYPAMNELAHGIAHEAAQPVEALRYLPLVSRQASWTAILAGGDARIVGYLPVDAFF